VPANRIGHLVYATAQLKTMQEVITLVVFAVFSVLYLKESPGITSLALRSSRPGLTSSSEARLDETTESWSAVATAMVG
jgi:hypothetical protein